MDCCFATAVDAAALCPTSWDRSARWPDSTTTPHSPSKYSAPKTNRKQSTTTKPETEVQKTVSNTGCTVIVISTLVASSGKRSVTVWRPSVRLSVPSAYTQHDSPGSSTGRSQRTFPSGYYENGHSCCHYTCICTHGVLKYCSFFLNNFLKTG